MSSKFTESTVEDAVLEWMEALGYSILHGPEIASGEAGAEREAFSDVLLAGRLREASGRLAQERDKRRWTSYNHRQKGGLTKC